MQTINVGPRVRKILKSILQSVYLKDAELPQVYCIAGTIVIKIYFYKSFSVVEETENHAESTENRSSDTNDVVTKKRSIRFDSKWSQDPVAINHQNFRPPIHYVPKVDMSSSVIISSGHPSAAASDGTKSESQGPNAEEFAQKVSKMSRNSMSRNSIKNFFTLYRTDPKKFS